MKNNEPITGSEFEQAWARWDNNGDGIFDDPPQTTPCPPFTVSYGGGCYYNITEILYVVKPDGTLLPLRQAYTLNSAEVQIFFDNNGDGVAQPYTLNAGQRQIQELVLFLAPTAVGDYTLKLVHAFSIPYTSD